MVFLLAGLLLVSYGSNLPTNFQQKNNLLSSPISGQHDTRSDHEDVLVLKVVGVSLWMMMNWLNNNAIYYRLGITLPERCFTENIRIV